VLSTAGAHSRWRGLLGFLTLGTLLLGAACAAPAPVGPAAGPAAGTAPAGSVASAPTAGQSGGAPASPTAPQMVKVAASASVSATGFFIGLERGYFREQGIDVEIVPFEGAK
jgi:NitT/TauT family transport system substrate-binding protein